MVISDQFMMLWTLGVIAGALVLRMLYARNAHLAQVLFWVLLTIFATPLGALVVYLPLRTVRVPQLAPKAPANTEI
ncbi:hypothetical protein E5843_14560 [Luteimonas yindakuii]|uniref:hypothetical protein n=1 Tax=Luteimonas yindakuii TaxID=2565782 RepID=UPI001107952E|nr:hypothetical protein [Luteimonas yindakuii]QCU72653.1 hypothetical protein E5843_14560 [Luteimonas yindakuii]